MASTEEKKTKKLGLDEQNGTQTFRELTEKRTCQKILARKYCTPWVDTRLKIHFGKNLTEQVIGGGAGATAAVAGGLAVAGAFATAGVSALVGLISTIVLQVERNPEGTLDVRVHVGGLVEVGSRDIQTSPGITNSIIQGLK